MRTFCDGRSGLSLLRITWSDSNRREICGENKSFSEQQPIQSFIHEVRHEIGQQWEEIIPPRIAKEKKLDSIQQGIGQPIMLSEEELQKHPYTLFSFRPPFKWVFFSREYPIQQ
jgi:hypothetical protein